MRSLPARAARDCGAARAASPFESGPVTPLLAAGNRAIAQLLGAPRQVGPPAPVPHAAGPPVVQRQHHDRLVRYSVRGETHEVSAAGFARVLERTLRQLDAAVSDLGQRSASYHLYRSGRGERAAGRGISAPRQGEPGPWDRFGEAVNTAVSYVSDAAGGTWAPTVEQLTRDPRRLLESARDALYSGGDLEPSTRETDWESAIRHMQKCEDAVGAGRHRWNRYLDQTQSGAERAAVTLGIVRDLSFTVVAAIATGGAATVAEGAAIGAGVNVLSEAATQEGESLAGLRDRPDPGRLLAAGGSGAVSGGLGAAVRPLGGPAATRIGRGMLAGGLTAATEETTRQTAETAFGERAETDFGRIGAAGLGGLASGGLVEATSGAGGPGPSRSAGARDSHRPPTATEPPGAAAGARHAEAVDPEMAPRAPGEREPMLPPEPGPRLPGERTALPPQDPEGYMAPLPAEPPAPVRRWPGYEPGLRDDLDIKPLTDTEVETARLLIESGVDARYRVEPPDVFERLYRRGGDTGPLPPGFVDRRGVVILPESTSGGGTGGGGGRGGSDAPRGASGPATIPDRASRAPTIPASPSRAPTLPGGRPTVPDVSSPTIPAAPPSGTTYRALTADEARAIVADLNTGTSRPNTLASRADSFDESFRAIHGSDAPLPEFGYVDDSGQLVVRFELLER